MKESIKIAIAKIKENQRYIWAFLAVILVFLINRGFPAEKITTESCIEGKCKTAIGDPSLSVSRPSFYINNAFDSKPGEYYRLIFQVRSNQKTSITSLVTNASDQDKKIESIDIENPNVNIIKEIIFKSDKKYSDLLFKKNISTDGADIYIDQINLSKLNISGDQDINKLATTITGEADMTIEDQAQEKNDFAFDQLKDPKLIFGQIFVPKTNFMTGVLLDIDIIKQSNNGGKEYKLELREVDIDSDSPDIKSNPISTLGFSVNDMEKYRQENGKLLFPLLAKLEPGKPYFIGINNDQINTDKFNYLILKGTKDKNSYPEGQLAVKYQKQSYTVAGSLYFKIYGFELKKYNNVSIPPGAIIEDLGMGQTQFSYKMLPNEFELINLNSKTGDIQYDSDNKSLFGEIKDNKDSYFIYKLETVIPFQDFSIFADQADPDWNKIKLSYSFDNENWQEIPPSILKNENNQEYQNFNFKIIDKSQEKKEAYVKAEPLKDKLPDENKYGVKNFQIKADLLTKK